MRYLCVYAPTHPPPTHPFPSRNADSRAMRHLLLACASASHLSNHITLLQRLAGSALHPGLGQSLRHTAAQLAPLAEGHKVLDKLAAAVADSQWPTPEPGAGAGAGGGRSRGWWEAGTGVAAEDGAAAAAGTPSGAGGGGMADLAGGSRAPWPALLTAGCSDPSVPGSHERPRCH